MSATSNKSGEENAAGAIRAGDSPCPHAGHFPERLLNAMQTAVVFFTTDGTICGTNTQARTDLQMTESPNGRKLTDAMAVMYRNENILPGLLARFEDPATEQVTLPRDALIRTRRKDGQDIVFFVTGCITALDCGRLLLSFRNVVDELTQEYMLKMALSSTRIFPWFYDMERTRMVIDPRYYDYTGIPTQDYTMTLEEFAGRIYPDDRKALFDAFDLQLHGAYYPYPVPFRLLRGDGRYEWFEGQSTYLGQVEGMPYRVVGICMSTQAHKDIEQALTTAKNRAEQSDRLKSAFLANMSHELRTPLNAIIGFSNLLAGGDVSAESDEGREYVDLINKNCDYLLTLVSDILDLSRIETGTMEYTFTEQPVGQILTDVYDNYRHRIPNDIGFDLHLPAVDLTIETDAVRLRQAMNNLLGNAVKFTTQGHIEMGYSLSADKRHVRLYVADTGRGIAADQYEKIFDRFYKIDTFVQGAGLGLSICKTIVASLGGTITVASTPRQGTRFTITLPLRQADIVSSSTESHE